MATKAKPKVSSAPASVNAADPLNVNSRLYRQLGLLLDDLERNELDISFPQRLSAMIAIGRVQKMISDLKKANLNAGAGSEVVKYAAAFKTADAAGGRKTIPGTFVIGEPDSGADDVFDDDDGPSAA